MISTLDDMRVWTRDLALGKLLSPAMKRERDRFLPPGRRRLIIWPRARKPERLDRP
jgi:hypothetical protein